MKQHIEAIISVVAVALGSLQHVNDVLQAVAYLVAIGSGGISIISFIRRGKKQG